MSAELAPLHTAGARPQDWRTPPALFAELERRFGRGGFTLDAAASKANALCTVYFDAAADALTQPWFGRVFVNPPYRELGPWVAKAHAEVEAGRAEVVVMLLPARLSARWYDEAERFGRIHRIRGRVAFVRDDDGRSAPFEASIVVVFEQPISAAGSAP